MKHFICIFTLLGLTAVSGVAKDAGSDWPVVYHEDFSSGKAEGWTFADPKVWKVVQDGDESFLSSTDDSDYKPEVRSPENIAWLEDLKVGSFVLDATVRSTQAEYGHRDVCFLFNRVDPVHYYYVHIATKADAHANSVFLVNGEPRVSICDDRTDGTKWTEHWHHVRVVRDVDSGKIQIFFDDMETPIMKASDKTFTEGGIGFGSFDDTADLLEITVRAPK
ncbi:MAG: hypothetical protein H6751_15835 [Candidatus Omnitrophica bacterium]|nr:hypothetical protein [Candidatus Omnitrophota bacterium]MCB9784434.1 hypothetical protein [Candidatus Omnitrophota bacterium]